MYFIYLFSFYKYSTNNMQIETYKHYKIYNNKKNTYDTRGRVGRPTDTCPLKNNPE